ncbi:ankyrin repeat-containing domain protein [Lasiosphaeria hispida]|uniref:Ankyrin repeat-containing domain protein n=1 Tax=Lasiosphaeria hispida TaxID=260671 RepID=A0AAJ0HEM6_9PEZI|nr:ankyrin repeat-containing domain protein [Lasiosphaeria hispida]
MSTKEDHAGNTPILLAAMAGHAAVVDELPSSSRAEKTAPKLLWRDSFPCHKSVLSANMERARILLSHGYEVDFADSGGSAPLHIVVKEKSLDMIKLLIQNSAKLSVTNSSGETALCLVVKESHLGASEAPLSAVDTEVKDSIDIQDDAKNTPLYYACRLSTDIVKLLLDKKADPNCRCSAGWTPLHAAAIAGMTEVIALLFDAGADHSLRNDYKSTAIILAAEAGEADTMRLLLDALFWQPALLLALPFAFVFDSPGQALQRSSSNYEQATLKLIEAGVGIDERGGEYGTALQAAAAAESIDLMKRLLEKGADPDVFHSGSRYGSALNAAVIHAESVEAVEILLEQGARPDVEYDGKMLIHLAVAQGSMEIVKVLLDHEANLAARDKQGRPLLSYAMHSGTAAVVDYLLSRPDIRIHDTNLGGRTPLITAIILDQHNVMDVVGRLLRLGANRTLRIQKGRRL